MTALPVLTWIGNAAVVLCGPHGAVTDHARQAGCSRQAAYEHARQVEQAVAISDGSAGGVNFPGGARKGTGTHPKG